MIKPATKRHAAPPGAAPRSAARKGPWPVSTRAGAARLAAIALFGLAFVLLLALLFLPRDRTFLIEAETGGVLIRPDGTERAVWRLPAGTLLCYRLEKGAAQVPGPVSDLCPDDFRAELPETALEFYWPQGVELDLRTDGAAGLSIVVTPAALPGVAPVDAVEIARGLPDLPMQSMIFLPREVLVKAGALPFSGGIDIGRLPDGGATGLLRSGRYSTRQVPVLQSDPEEVQSGTLTLGDRIRIEDTGGGAPPAVYGFLSASQSGGVASIAFSVVAVSAPARADLVVERYSGDPSRISPTWVDRAKQDPLLLGATAVLTILTVFLTLLKDIAGFLAGRPKPD